MDDLLLFRNRMSELAARSDNKCIYTYSDFLTSAQQSELVKMRLPIYSELYGGYDNAERCIAVFGDASDLGYPSSPPVSFISIAPLQMKFADSLTHRDFLGSLMGLGIRREMLGDIIIKDNCAYLICIDSVTDYITENLDKVKHTSVKCTACDALPHAALPELTYKELIISSERLDVVISAVYNLSRNESKVKIESELVFCNSVLQINSSYPLPSGTVVSVRGHGRFIYDGVLRTTKKDRNVVAVRIY